MELKEGMYVRFATGFDIKMDKPIIRIGKIENINDCCITINVFSRQIIVSLKEFEELKIKEPSNNIIDLIEERDFVKVRIDNIFINWFMVDLFEDENENQELGIGCYEDGLLNSISEYRPLNTLEILEVVTKEQFEGMSYKVN